ncbi:MAG: biotin--[acetyl-CoA-carboxylase] ligase [Tannerella sp.]|jgi:BirA family biotin operon repressor/biotin-[acetyl-CoA-carboxylase] ligase|nr:biotin--[acetyl-CoA-carboxylase] ligase [Tannerella sp.]
MNQKKPIFHLPETESTNQSLRLWANTRDLPDLSMLWTDYQTCGRGQTGNAWESEPGMNLLCSILFYPAHLPANQSFAISEIASLSVKYTLDPYVSGLTIKWPNDIYYQHKKICGILIENDLSEGIVSRSVIGLGINLNQKAFNNEAPNAVSLAMITGMIYDREELYNQLHTNFKRLSDELNDTGIDSIHQKYIASLYRRDGFHAYQDLSGCFEARIHDIEPSGHIILQRRNHTLSRYGFKEVTSKL